LEEGRAAIVELEKRIAEARVTGGQQSKRRKAPGNEEMRKLVLDLAEERKRVSPGRERAETRELTSSLQVARLQAELQNTQQQKKQVHLRLTDLQEAPARLQSGLETARTSLNVVVSTVEQRKKVLGRLIEQHKKALISLGISEHAKQVPFLLIRFELIAESADQLGLLQGTSDELSLSPKSFKHLWTHFSASSPSHGSQPRKASRSYHSAVPRG
jgi:hypothetical protein